MEKYTKVQRGSYQITSESRLDPQSRQLLQRWPSSSPPWMSRDSSYARSSCAASGEPDDLSRSVGRGEGGFGHSGCGCGHCYGVLVGVQVTVERCATVSGAGLVVEGSDVAPLGIAGGLLPGAAEESPEEAHSPVALTGAKGSR